MKDLKSLYPHTNTYASIFEKMVNKKQIAAHVGISVSYINKLMKKKRIRFHKLGKRVLFKVSEVMEDLQKWSLNS